MHYPKEIQKCNALKTLNITEEFKTVELLNNNPISFLIGLFILY
jgi:hypothetical protein